MQLILKPRAEFSEAVEQQSYRLLLAASCCVLLQGFVGSAWVGGSRQKWGPHFSVLAFQA